MLESPPFTLPRLPPAALDWNNLLPLLGATHSAVARFDALLKNFPHTRLLLSPVTTNEAVVSSRIEGTEASLEDVMRFQAKQKADDSRRDDIQEVINYRQAMVFAFEVLRSGGMTLSERLLKETHRILRSGVRSAYKSPGEFREGQVYITASNKPIEEATYVPPQANLVPGLIHDLVRYIDSEELDVMVQLAIVHAQFELIHPFRDGNGRIGRLIMPLFLYAKKIIHAPYFYLSEYLEKHRGEYYGCLQAISAEGNWGGWINFFLQAVIRQSDINAKKVRDIITLKSDTLQLVRNTARSRYVPQIVDHLCSSPVFTTVSFRNNAQIPSSSVGRLLKQLEGIGVIRKTGAGKGRRTSTYVFDDLMRILTR